MERTNFLLCKQGAMVHGTAGCVDPPVSPGHHSQLAPHNWPECDTHSQYLHFEQPGIMRAAPKRIDNKL